MTLTDTGVLQRNLFFSKITSRIIAIFFNPHGKFLDYGGGYGLFVRLMRDIGFDFYWYDKYADNIFCKGFEWKEGRKDRIEMITSFETFEHFVEPIKEIEKMVSISRNILFSTVLYGETVPAPEKWWYYSFETGQHICFYNMNTLKFIANKYGLNLCTNGKSIHLLTCKKISNKWFNFVLKVGRFLPLRVLTKNLKSKTWEDFQAMRSFYLKRRRNNYEKL